MSHLLGSHLVGRHYAPGVPAYLEEIVAAHRRAAAGDTRDVEELALSALACPPTRGFADALRGGGLSVIAELKRRSPSKGALATDLDPARDAAAYGRGGAAALSVLTDRAYFGALDGDLGAARGACELPVLRKDFTVCAQDVCDARLMGADAVLLVVAALSDQELGAFRALAAQLSLDALVEVHDEAELDRALGVGAELVGVNRRDLSTFCVDPDRAERLAARLPSHVVAVAESGVEGKDDAAQLAAAGFDAVLVGEALVRAHDKARAVGDLVGHPVAPRSLVRGR